MSGDRLVRRRRVVVELAWPLAVVIGAWAIVSVGWLGRATADAEAEVDAIGVERLALIDELDSLQTLDAERASVAAEDERLAAAVPDDPDLDGFVDEVAASAAAAGVVVEQFAPVAVTSAAVGGGSDLPDGVTSIELSITVVGDYAGLMAFVADVESFDRLVLIDAISLLADDDVVDRLTLDVVMRVFTRADSASALDVGFDEFEVSAADDGADDGSGTEGSP
ncbi:MAG: type 4a pilus biogenesis protein PilO [Acidimicrobiales bacterium]